MNTKKYILALDQGTTSSRAIIFSKNGEIIDKDQQEYTQYFPQKGWVEHDANEIFETQLQVAKNVLNNQKITAEQIAGIGITNQRETTVIWDKTTGEPIYHAIVWQDKRTADYCLQLKDEGHGEMIHSKTGLPIDAYFSATKIRWILTHVPNALERAKKGSLLFGTIDTWLIWKLTGGKIHTTDPSNASRTLLYNINTLQWDDELLELFGIPAEILPKVKASDSYFGDTAIELFGTKVPIRAVLGDQQAALFGQQCWNKGNAKNTYGTGCFLLLNTGHKPTFSKKGLITTIAWQRGDETIYALEGSVFIGGAAIQWLRDGLKLINDAAETDQLAQSVDGSNGVYFVPAFAGLGAPYWNMEVKGSILGITRDTTKAHIVSATLEGIAYQSMDVLKAMEADGNVALKKLKVDGGATANQYLMQFQADILNTIVEVAFISESTALGVAILASLSLGLTTESTLIELSNKGKKYLPNMSESQIEVHYQGWKDAIRRIS